MAVVGDQVMKDDQFTIYHNEINTIRKASGEPLFSREESAQCWFRGETPTEAAVPWPLMDDVDR